MIPEWEKALNSAKSLMSADGRVIVSDFDTYTEKGNSIKDVMIRTWYKQDGVRIDARSREVIQQKVFPPEKFIVTVARFQRKLAGVSIPHYVACCRKGTITAPDGLRRPSEVNLAAYNDEKKIH